MGLTPRNQSGNRSKSLNMYVGMLGTSPPKQKNGTHHTGPPGTKKHHDLRDASQSVELTEHSTLWTMICNKLL